VRNSSIHFNGNSCARLRLQTHEIPNDIQWYSEL